MTSQSNKGKGDVQLERRNFVRDRSFESIRLGMHRTTLFFDEREQELQFRQNYFNKSRKIVQYCVTGLVIIAICVFVIDQYYFGYDKVEL